MRSNSFGDRNVDSNARTRPSSIVSVGASVTAIPGHDFGEAVALEAAARHDVEYAITAVAEAGAHAAALGLERRDILRVELGAARRQIAVGHRHAVDQPRDAMTAARVQMIVHDERARDVIGDHRQAAAAVGRGLQQDVVAMGLRLRRRGFGIDGGRLRRDVDGLHHARQRHLRLHRRLRVGQHFDAALEGLEPRRVDGDAVGAKRHRDENGFPFGVGLLHLRPGGHHRFDAYLSVRDGQILRIADDDADASEHLRVARRHGPSEQKYNEYPEAEWHDSENVPSSVLANS
jgi:hypothetical protein